MRHDERRRREGGQALVLLLVAILLAGVMGLGLIRVAVASSHRAAAQAAADASALAGAAEGEAAARRLAEANEAHLLSYRVDGLDVEVVVRRHGVEAVARARLVFRRFTRRRLRCAARHPVCSPPCQPTDRDPPPGRFRPTLPGPVPTGPP